jgi:hypothetical protein
MTDAGKLERQIERRARAEVLMRDELLVEAFTVLEAAYYEGWKNSKPGETAARERLWQAAQIVPIVRAHLTLAIENGKVAQAELDEVARAGGRRLYAVP